MFEWSAKVRDSSWEYHLAVIRGNGKTGFCLGFVAWWFVHLQCQVVDPEFDPRHKSVFSHSFFLSRPVLVEHLTYMLL